ncbi:MAG: GAF domain-containing protein [Myxococcota bacterium]
MMPAPIPADDHIRVEALHALDVLDQPADETFDRYTRLLSATLSVPIALVSLIDLNRQWFLSRVGLDATETPREVSFCGHAIMQSEPLVIDDATADPRFADNPVVTGPPFVRFYAGAPLRTPSGHAIGTLCAIDTVKRRLASSDIAMLKDLAAMVSSDMVRRALQGVEEATGLPRRERFLALLEHYDELACRRDVSTTRLRVRVDAPDDGLPAGDHAERSRFLVALGAHLRRSLSWADAVGRVAPNEFGLMALDKAPDELMVAREGIERDAELLAARMFPDPARRPRVRVDQLETAVGQGRFKSLFDPTVPPGGGASIACRLEP